MKYPNCRYCRKIKEMFPEIPDEMIDAYHESRIGWADFPKRYQDDIIEIMLNN